MTERTDDYPRAPELDTDIWYNTNGPLSLAGLRGRVVVLEAFQMLCPGCVAHGLPQAQRVERTFGKPDVAVLGLHTVFEHHAAMTPISLEAFLHEYRITFPIAVDRPDGTGMPRTMNHYNMRGTPTLILIDAAGRLRHHWFGRIDDLTLGAEIMRLVQERDAGVSTKADQRPGRESGVAGVCDESRCPTPPRG